jgi:hypothetical protein
MHGTMSFEEKAKSLTDWFVLLQANGRSVEIRVKDQLYSGADEVLSLGEEQLFTSSVPASAV